MSEIINLDSDSDNDIDEANLPSREECEARCQMFAEVTGTDTALAQFYLQDREWNVERAISDFFTDQGQDATARSAVTSIISSAIEAPKSETTSKTTPTTKREGNKSGETSATASTEKAYLTTVAPILQPENENRIRVLSWNIDGLDPDNRDSRAEGACSVLLQENPEVIFLQEVVERSQAILEANCGQKYHLHFGMEEPVPGAYYTAMALRKDCVTVESVNMADFPGSLMTRNLLEVQCKVKDIPMTFLTSHLESTAEYSEERRRQLKMAFSRMQAIDKDRTVVFGGDLNLREKELKGPTAIPDKVYDVWECTGKRPEAKFTWDLTINDNKQLGLKFQPRCRFDRIYVRHSNTVKVKPVYFELAGIQRLAACQRFVSDHWGILAHFDIL